MAADDRAARHARAERVASIAGWIATAAVIALAAGMVIRAVRPGSVWGALAPLGVVLVVLFGVAAMAAGSLADRYSTPPADDTTDR
ncbi:hypothetical protein GCM10011608_10650 [Micromonospora sonchi]|uniref:Uncharacterized protein n=1 Tax=Micromonospora sonchi TaxID=1763543 RepID=A0A917TML6_9ACTN|nr:hypothetical protein [Micromonospora sonchi]GGM27704.1 hypothetical protein GCM10011608_10650 [Micromonospora sonchi]